MSLLKVLEGNLIPCGENFMSDFYTPNENYLSQNVQEMFKKFQSEIEAKAWEMFKEDYEKTSVWENDKEIVDQYLFEYERLIILDLIRDFSEKLYQKQRIN
jgi:hypothetical protein